MICGGGGGLGVYLSKVKFENEEKLEEALAGVVVINRHRYIMERFRYRPKLIQCYNCYKFAHVARLCWKVGSVCGKCASTDHPTKDCQAHHNDFKCINCGGNHESTSKYCEVVKLKLEELASRQNGR